MKVSPYRAAKTGEKKKQALDLYKQGLSLRAVSRAVGMSHQWVSNAIAELNGTVKVGKFPIEKLEYGRAHVWIYKFGGNSKTCEHCGTVKEKQYQWANKSGKYKKQLDDWFRLCIPCHRIFDRNKKMLLTDD